MKRIVGGSEMKALDGCTITGMGVPSCVLMERAALAVVDAMEGHLAEMSQKQRILCVCGGGNNGGDGVAIARILHLHGYNAESICSEIRITAQRKHAASLRLQRIIRFLW